MNTKAEKRSRILLRVRSRTEGRARRAFDRAAAGLREIDARLAVLERALWDYDDAARRATNSGGDRSVLAGYGRRTGDIRRALKRVRERRRAAGRLFGRRRQDLVRAHRLRRASDEYHARIVRAAHARQRREAAKEFDDIHAARTAGGSGPVEV